MNVLSACFAEMSLFLEWEKNVKNNSASDKLLSLWFIDSFD